jgi:hypothetical protein
VLKKMSILEKHMVVLYGKAAPAISPKVCLQATGHREEFSNNAQLADDW